MSARAADVFIDPIFHAEFGRHPLVLADIGARGGLKKDWRAAREHLRLVGFEPDAEEFARLEARARESGGRHRYFQIAVHNQRGTLPIHVARDRGLTSMFEPNRAFLDAFPDAERFDIVDRREIETDTLDAVLAGNGITDLDFVKADTQGSELFVLEGASRALAGPVVGVEVEVEFAPIYTGQPLFADVDAFMRGLGYALFDLRPCYWKRAAGRDLGGPYGQIVWGDALYLKGWPALSRQLASLDREAARAKMLHALVVSLLYGYADHALDLAGHTADLWTPAERAAIDARLRVRTGRNHAVPKFPGRGRVAGALRHLWTRLREPNDAWSVSDADLGNTDS